MGLAVDMMLVVIGAVAVVRAWRRGALVAFAAALGWGAGLWVGLDIAPMVVNYVTRAGWVSVGWRTVAVAVVVLASAGICDFLLVLVASGIRRALRSRPVAQGIDAVGGGIIGALTWAAAVWLLAGFAASTNFLPLTQISASSRVVQLLNSVAPVKSSSALGQLDDAFAAAGLPRVFEGVEKIPDVAAPTPGIPTAVNAVAASVVEVLADAPGCGITSTGSGWVISQGRVVTNAHVVAGSNTTSVRIGDTATPLPATVVAFDPEVDLAVLQVPGLNAPALKQGQAIGSGIEAYAAGYPGGGPYNVQPTRVREVFPAIGKDIYNKKSVTRQVYSLRGLIRPGNSGGPLVNAAGQVVGVVFARSDNDSDTGYALTLSEVSHDLTASASTHSPVSTGACAAD